MGDELINVSGTRLRSVSLQEARKILEVSPQEVDIVVARLASCPMDDSLGALEQAFVSKDDCGSEGSLERIDNMENKFGFRRDRLLQNEELMRNLCESNSLLSKLHKDRLVALHSECYPVKSNRKDTRKAQSSKISESSLNAESTMSLRMDEDGNCLLLYSYKHITVVLAINILY